MQKPHKKPTQKSFMKITTKKLPSEKFYSFGYLVAELQQYELKTFYDGKNFSHKFVGFTLYKAKKRFIEMIDLGIVKGFNKKLTK